MRIALFYHSLISDWNHGNAHFLRGICTELLRRGHDLRVYEPRDSWSLQNLIAGYGQAPVERFYAAYPQLRSIQYDLPILDLDSALEGCGLVLVHEWNDPELVRRIGNHHIRNHRDYTLLFHDTHHRSVTAPASMAAYDLRGFDGVLAFGTVIRDLYLANGWTDRAWTWHESADTNIFRPQLSVSDEGAIVWIGNWGDEERTEELREFLINPVQEMQLKARVFGVRYPEHALQILAESGIDYGGWIPNFSVPRVFGGFKLTIHIPRRPYATLLPGIPTIRVFEALACGIPLICSPWEDTENLFDSGDFLIARTGAEMKDLIRAVLVDSRLSKELAERGRQTILRKHTCSHRVDELLEIYSELAHDRSKEDIPACRKE